MPVAAGARVKPEPLISKQLKEKPKSLKKIDYDEWQAWGKFGRLQPYGFDLQTILRSRTEGLIAHDYEYIYVGVRAYEPTREPIANKSDVCANDHVEFFIERSDKKLFQVAVILQSLTDRVSSRKDITLIASRCISSCTDRG